MCRDRIDRCAVKYVNQQGERIILAVVLYLFAVIDPEVDAANMIWELLEYGFQPGFQPAMIQPVIELIREGRTAISTGQPALKYFLT